MYTAKKNRKKSCEENSYVDLQMFSMTNNGCARFFGEKASRTVTESVRRHVQKNPADYGEGAC